MRTLVVLFCILTLFATCSDKRSLRSPVIVPFASPSQELTAEPYLLKSGGTVLMSWVQRTESRSILWYSSLHDTTWSKPIPIDSGANWFVNWADYPMMAANGENLVAHYLARSGQSKYAYDIMLATSGDHGVTWKRSGKLHDDGKQAEHGFVSMLPYNEGFVIAWLDGRNTVLESTEGHDGHGRMTLRAAIVNAQGVKADEWELDSSTCDCCQTALAITKNGPVVIYRDRSDDEIRDMSIVRYSDGRWTDPKTINNDNWKITGCPVNGPSAAAVGDDLAVAWFTAAEERPMVQLAFSDDGGATFAVPIRLDEGKAIGRVDVVMLEDRSVVVSLMEGAAVKAARVSRKGIVGKPLLIATSSEARSSGFPQVAVTGKRVVFAWTDEASKSIRTAYLPL